MRDKKVMDYNAVDFSMRGGAFLWVKHRDFIPRRRAASGEIAEFSVPGLFASQGSTSLFQHCDHERRRPHLLGEDARPARKLATKVTRDSNQVFRYTQAAGIHEFDSPTYTGVDLDGLGMIEAFCRRDAGRPETERGKSRRI